MVQDEASVNPFWAYWALYRSPRPVRAEQPLVQEKARASESTYSSRRYRFRVYFLRLKKNGEGFIQNPSSSQSQTPFVLVNPIDSKAMS